MKPYASFDLETNAIAPRDEPLSRRNAPAITCAAAALQDRPEPITWHAPLDSPSPVPPMSPGQTRSMLADLTEIASSHTLVTWNGTSFDLLLLAIITGEADTCRRITLNHVDMMFHIFVHKGWPISLQTLATGLRLQGKSPDMSGADAPALWRQGHHRRVADYCKQDAQTTLEVAAAADGLRQLAWRSQSGRIQTLPMPHGWLTVEQAREVPQPDNSWMNEPIPRSRFTHWLRPDSEL